MPYIETVSELAEVLADALGVYNHGLRFEGMTVAESQALRHAGDESGYENHATNCGCRQCWCGRMEERIRDAVANDQRREATPA